MVGFGNFFCKEPRSKYFRPRGSCITEAAIQLRPSRAKAARDNTKANGHCPVPKKCYLWILKFKFYIFSTYHKMSFPFLSLFFNYLRRQKPFLACGPYEHRFACESESADPWLPEFSLEIQCFMIRDLIEFLHLFCRVDVISPFSRYWSGDHRA